MLGHLRDASEPVTSRQITEGWVAHRGLVADDGAFVILRKRAGACLIALRAAGLASDSPLAGDYEGWRLA